ncbi:MAG: hypothetical protein ACI31W_02090 [Lactococcus sp.]
MSQRTIGKRSKNMKKWICDFFEGLWYDFKDDPFEFIFMIVLLLLVIVMIGCFAVLIYAVCTGQISADNGDSNNHGITWIPMPSGKGVSMVPIPY